VVDPIDVKTVSKTTVSLEKLKLFLERMTCFPHELKLRLTRSNKPLKIEEIKILMYI
jgi:hypothetical protein